jgi:hypothetical protein
MWPMPSEPISGKKPHGEPSGSPCGFSTFEHGRVICYNAITRTI